MRAAKRGRSVTTYYLTAERPQKPQTHARKCQCDLCWPVCLYVRARTAQHALPWFARAALRDGFELAMTMPVVPVPIPRKTRAQRKAEKAAARERAARAAYADTNRTIERIAAPCVPATAAELEELKRDFPDLAIKRKDRP